MRSTVSHSDARSGSAERRPLYCLLTATAIGQAGNMMTIVAGPWFVLELTGSAAKTGLLTAALVLGGVVPAVLGGPVVDRLGWKRASVFGDVASGIVIAAVPLLHLVGVLNFWALIALVFVLSSFNTQGDTGRYGLVPGLTRRAGLPIEKVNALDRATVRAGALIGPLVGGILIAVIGAANVLLVDAATFLISAALIGFGVPRDERPSPTAPAERSGARYRSELLDGLRFMRANRLLLYMVLIATIGNALDKPLISVVAPVYAERYFGNGEVLGLIVGAFGGGALIGTLAYGQWARRLPRRATFLSCFVLSPLLGFGALALRPSLATVVIAAVLAGVAAGPINPIYETVIQQQAPPHMLGRVFGTITALAYAGIPLGAILAGVLIEQIGLIQTIVGMGALYLLVTGSAWFLPVLRGIDAQPEPARAVSSGVELGPVYTPARGAGAGSGVASDIRP